MTIVFPSNTRTGAWLQAVEHLLVKEHDLNVILSIDAPASGDSQKISQRIDSFFSEAKEDPLHTVAETIFPGWEYMHRGISGVFDTYSEGYALLKKGEPQRWGTYAHRLISRRTANGEKMNPLGKLIEKMRNERDQQYRGTLRACYEMGMAEAEYDLPLYNTVDDQGRRRGLPCLSHLSFKLVNDTVHLTAIYRSHDYRYKVPGNLLGLARLQACVAHEVGVQIGSLVVHSTYAYMDLANKKRVRELVADVRGLMADGDKP